MKHSIFYFILESDEINKLTLASILNKQEFWIDANYLKSKLDISRSHFGKIIKELQEDIEENFDYCKLLISNNRYYLQIEADFSVQTLLSCYLSESVVYKFLNQIFSNNITSISDFCRDNFVSYGALYTRIKKLQPLLKKFDLDFYPKCLTEIKGSEAQIRYFYMLLYWSAFSGTQWPFQIEREKINQAIDDIEVFLNTQLTGPERELYRYIIAVSVERILLQKSIGDSISNVDESYLPLKELLRSSLSELIKPSVFLNIDSELNFLNRCFFSSILFVDISPFIKEKDVNSLQMKEAVTFSKEFCELIKIVFLENNECNAGVESLAVEICHFYYKLSHFKGGLAYFVPEEFILPKKMMFWNSLTERILSKIYFPFPDEVVRPHLIYILFRFFMNYVNLPKLEINFYSLFGKCSRDYFKEVIEADIYIPLHFRNTREKYETGLIISDRKYEFLPADAPIILWRPAPTTKEIAMVKQKIILSYSNLFFEYFNF
ncbi:helix-turn-helix domain-containing protein [Enterococcus thailandicus]|uniref:helix-turn-helix domain-containing protein n=1 Tax=Enterococcus thailandicus TaxID=417368 RepID=UPI0022EBF90C|nr:helix-turn-helix domain-containing protein [Enterococcus thailandicus]MDA3972741.1 helix-turn-helix domain-containing protein [Enterococcus thailandicus]MDA3975237.1 helix-turn-helix domain-containing protein [Enterococcus thailandicus]MDA3980201.1 helix-turn-helix domain-containing protein [Enterococcus thailandicus]